MPFTFPNRGLVFWPVANGDSTTIVIDSKTVLQIDLNNLQRSGDDHDPTWSVVDELVARLPKRDSRPYLAVFGLTHPDKDHCCGFEKFLKEVDIGEIWVSPRVFAEYKEDLSDDAKAFKREAERRRTATIDANGDPGAGNRVRLFGYAELLNMEEFKDFPHDRLVIPGETELTTVDEVDFTNSFCAVSLSPFKEYIEGERNDSSLGMQITLYDGGAGLRVLLLGDLRYPALKRIFEVREPTHVAWNVLLAPHHCSKSAMYWKDDGEGDETLRQDILNALDSASENPNCIVSSSNPVPVLNGTGDNPPHAKAKKRYEEITTAFLCTMEHPNKDKPEPVVAKLEDGKLRLTSTAVYKKSAAEAAADARGGDEPPRDAVTYG